MAGVWVALADVGSPGRSLDLAMYSSRLTAQTLWKLGEKKGIVKGIKNGEVIIFSLSMAVLLSLYEVGPRDSIPGTILRSALEQISGRQPRSIVV